MAYAAILDWPEAPCPIFLFAAMNCDVDFCARWTNDFSDLAGITFDMPATDSICPSLQNE
jgi:hypothetical protein